MTWTNLSDLGLTGLDGLLIGCANAWPGFTPFVLFVLFMIVLLGSYFAGKRISGNGNFSGAFFVASFFTFVVMIVMTAMKQTVDGITYKMLNGVAGGITGGVVIAVFIASVIVLFMDGEED